MSRLLIASTWFQIIWFLAVLGQEQWQWVTVALGVATLCFATIERPQAGLRILLFGGFGIVIDYTNMWFGLLSFREAYVPAWLMVLWVVFVWYAREWVPSLVRYPLMLVALMVGLGGAASYWAGYRFEAVHFGFTVSWTLCVLFVEWLCVALLIMKVFGNEYSTSNQDLVSDDTVDHH